MPEHDFRVTTARSVDERLREVGPHAAGIWALSGSWSCSAGTDGWVAAHYVRSWPGGAGSAKKLVRVGLWSEHRRGTQDGWLFNQEEWLREQRLAVEVAEARDKAARRQKEKRQRDKDARLRDSGQLTTGPMGVPTPAAEGAVTANVTRDAPRTSHTTVTRDVTPMRHGERALPPIPSLPSEGSSEEEGTRSERADSPASSSHDPLGDDQSAPPEPQRSAHGRFVDELRAMPRDELADLDRRCNVHAQLPPGCPTPPCTDCQRRGRTIRRVLDDRTLTEQRTVTDVSIRRRVCPDCDEYGFVLGEDQRPVEPLVRCPHPQVPPTATGTGAGP